MEPNNIEKVFKNTLQQRTIQPSEAAWDRLDAMLTIAEEKKAKRSFGWLYIAASFLGFGLIVTVFLSQTEELIDVPKNSVVIENQMKPDTTAAVQVQEIQKEAIVVQVNAANKDKKSNPNQVRVSIIAPTKDAGQINQKINNQNEIAIVQQTNTQHPTPNTQQLKPIYVNVDALLASVEPSSDQNFDKKSGIKVNATGLLAQVDGELELSFREKVIQTVNKNYKTVRVALANRNTQQ